MLPNTNSAVRVLAPWRIGLGVMMALAATANCQELTPRERELMQVIENLQRRVEDIERKLDDAEDAPGLNDRVQELENKVGAIPADADEDFRVYWGKGLRLDSRDGRFKLKIGGRIQNDFAFFDENSTLRKVFGDNENDTEFRRARLYISGTIYDRYAFKAQYDFAGGDADFKDVFVAANKIPYAGQLKIGHFKEPFSLEELTSSKYITFMERALPNVFAPSRNMGLQLSNHHFNDRFTWSVGLFRETDRFGGGVDDGGFNWTGRVTGLPWYADDGRKLLHVGLSYSRRNPGGLIRFRQRPETHLAQTRYVDTGEFLAEDVQLYNAEFALVFGPFSLQGEYMRADAGTVLAGDTDFDGWYVQASWFITGEHRRYKNSLGVFDRIKPSNNFGWGEEQGPGAWELAVRLSNLDLDDGFFRGGNESNVTAALNCYLNPNMRVMLNAVHAEIDHIYYDGNADSVMARFQIDF
ncbi:MAG: porin [Nitrospiraceae bacterium]|nr:porin [Nitrospiraceae bacterium]